MKKHIASHELSEAEAQSLINTMINGVGILISLEKQLERGETVNLNEVS